MNARTASLLLALLLIVPAMPFARAGDGSEDELDRSGEDGIAPAEEDREGAEASESDGTDDEWEGEERELEVEAHDEGFDYESKRSSDLAKDAIHAEFDGSASSFRFEYEAEGANDSSVHFRVDFVALMEHTDTDGDGAYDVGEPVLQRVELDGLAPTVSAHDEGPVHVVDVRYALAAGGSLTLRFHVASEQASVGAATITPTMAKYDVLLESYPWRSSTSRVALETRTRTTLETDFDPDHAGEPGVEFARGDIGGFYRWVNTTTVDGRAEPVGATVLAQRTDASSEGYEHASVVLFSYAHGADIVHDPSIGVERLKAAIGSAVEAIRGDWRVFALAIVGTAVVVLATALPRMRRP